MNEFCRRYASSQGGRYATDILNALFDLQETWVAREIGDGKVEYFQILGDIKIHQRTARRREALRALSMQQEMWLDRVTLSPEFFGLLKRWEELARICLKHVLTSIRNPKAQAIYTYVPSRAVHRTKSQPFAINLATILEQIGAPVPSAKSKRKQIFTQNNNSMLSQLNGAEIVDGIIRAELAETRDGSDYKLIVRVENGTAPEPVAPLKTARMLEAWLMSGRSRASFQERLRNAGPLPYHHLELLERVGMRLEKTERFFAMACALLGHRCERVLSEAKGDAMEGDGRRNPTGRLIYRMLHELEQG